LADPFPDPDARQRISSTGDYEQLSYDANGNVISGGLRDGQEIISLTTISTGF
jgi:hypothetical protein